jgi:cysteine desulfurase
MSLFKRQITYLDSASGFGNSSSVHKMGKRAFEILEESRLGIAETIGSKKDEIIFTGSGSESIGLAIMGTVYKVPKNISIPHIITSTIEHSAVLNTCKILEERGDAEVTYIKPHDNTGILKTDDIINAIKENTVIISIHMVNNEIGIIQSIPELLKELNHLKEKKYNIKRMHFSSGSYYPYLHIDASQAYGHIDLVSLVKSGIDMITFNSNKIGGPAGIGALYKKRSVSLSPIYGGGKQELGLRPGTISHSLAHDFYTASKMIFKNRENNEKLYLSLKNYFITGLEKIQKENDFPFRINSSHNCVPGIVSISFPYFTGQQFAIELDARGIIVSNKSACNSNDGAESYVIKQIREFSKHENLGTIRISFRPETRKNDINKLLFAIKDIIQIYKNVLY